MRKGALMKPFERPTNPNCEQKTLESRTQPWQPIVWDTLFFFFFFVPPEPLSGASDLSTCKGKHVDFWPSSSPSASKKVPHDATLDTMRFVTILVSTIAVLTALCAAAPTLRNPLHVYQMVAQDLWPEDKKHQKEAIVTLKYLFRSEDWKRIEHCTSVPQSRDDLGYQY